MGPKFFGLNGDLEMKSENGPICSFDIELGYIGWEGISSDWDSGGHIDEW